MRNMHVIYVKLFQKSYLITSKLFKRQLLHFCIMLCCILCTNVCPLFLVGNSNYTSFTLIKHFHIYVDQRGISAILTTNKKKQKLQEYYIAIHTNLAEKKFILILLTVILRNDKLLHNIVFRFDFQIDNENYNFFHKLSSIQSETFPNGVEIISI